MLEQGAARQRRAPVRRARLCGIGWRDTVAGAIRAPEKGIHGLLSGGEQCWPPACARRRARLAADVLVAARYGFPGSKTRFCARNRAGLRSSADDVGNSRRQYLFELPGSQPGVLASERAAARGAHWLRANALAVADLWRKTSCSPPTRTKSRP